MRLDAPDTHDCTDAKGRFELSGLPRGQIRIEVVPYGIPKAFRPDRVVRAQAGGKDLDIRLDMGEQFTVRARGARFEAGVTWGRRYDSCLPPNWSRLYVQTKAGWVWWAPTVQDGALVFRCLPRGRPWGLYIPTSDDVGGTAFVSGTALKPGLRTVVHERGKHIRGRVLPSKANCSYASLGTGGAVGYGVLARRGGVRVEGDLDLDGRVRLPRLPSGTWKVVAFFRCFEEKQTFYMVATQSVEAGGTVELVPRSVSREAYLEARRW